MATQKKAPAKKAAAKKQAAPAAKSKAQPEPPYVGFDLPDHLRYTPFETLPPAYQRRLSGG